jgi:hypothetical protein
MSHARPLVGQRRRSHKLADEITAMVEEIRQSAPMMGLTPNGDGARDHLRRSS